MDLNFERGRADAPGGHALVYFTDPTSGAVLATYVVVLPIALNLAKYVPPMLAAQLPLGELQGIGAVPLPPLPEPVESQGYLTRLATRRNDDLVNAGSLNPGDLQRAMTLVAEIAQRYAQLYADAQAREPVAVETTEQLDSLSDTSANDVIYQLMSEQQKLGELAKLAGQLRYAVDGTDRRQTTEVAAEMTRLAQHLPPTYDVTAFIAAAQLPGDVGRHLAELYLDRCFKLAAEDYMALEQIDREIGQLRGS